MTSQRLSQAGSSGARRSVERAGGWSILARAIAIALTAALAAPAVGQDQAAPTQQEQAAERDQPQADDQPRSQLRDQADQAEPAPEQDEDEGAVDGETMVSFEQFAEPISLGALIDFVSEKIGVNIIQTDTGLEGQMVEFNAPVQVRVEDLPDLLQTLLAPRNYALVRSPQGFYMVTPAGDLAPDFEPEKYASTRIFPTPLVRPTSLESAINTALGDAADNAKLVFLDDLGLIISTTAPRVNETIAQIIDIVQNGIREQDLFRFELDHVAASEARDRILELTGQQRQRSGQEQQRGGGATASLGNLSERLLLDRPSNALILRGSEAEADHLRRYVETVDVPSRLIVRRYFGGPTSGQIVRVGERQGLGPVIQGGGAAGPGGQGEQTLGSAFVLPGGESPTFTYYGTEHQHQQVEELVEQFSDEANAQELVVRFYKLQHINAEDGADLLTTLMDLEGAAGDPDEAESPFLPPSPQTSQRGIRRTDQIAGAQPDQQQQQQQQQPDGADGQGQEPTITPTEGVAVIADEQNNQLIIRAPSRQQREFAQMIERIDRRRPQVYIEVQIVSVNASEDFRFRIDTAFQSPASDVPFFTNFGLIEFGDNEVPTGNTGITTAVIDDDFVPVIINTLAEEGRGRTMSTPSLLVNDNESATLSSTRDEPFSEVSQVAGAPTSTGLGGTLSAGTTLDLTPHISEGGFLRLELALELSSFGERPNPDLPPAINADRFESVVTVPSQSTIVIGGLTFETENDSVSKVPLLGDIPLIKHAFRSVNEEDSVRTVYAFITPRILRDPAFTDLRLLARGPLQKVGLKPPTPELAPARMRIFGSGRGGSSNADSPDHRSEAAEMKLPKQSKTEADNGASR